MINWNRRLVGGVLLFVFANAIVAPMVLAGWISTDVVTPVVVMYAASVLGGVCNVLVGLEWPPYVSGRRTSVEWVADLGFVGGMAIAMIVWALQEPGNGAMTFRLLRWGLPAATLIVLLVYYVRMGERTA